MIPLIHPESQINKRKFYTSIYSESEFRELMTRERARCDRNGSHFALLALTLGKNWNEKNLHQLITMLKNRIRSIDDIGWFGKNTVGVILPGTTHQGAVELAGYIHKVLNPVNGFYETDIYEYPNSNFPPTNEKDTPFEKPEVQVENELFRFIGHPLPVWKRVLDISGAMVALAILFPLLVATAIYIKIVSPGPILFRQRRIGYLGTPFTCLKFRTMKVDVDAEKHQRHVRHLIRNSKTLTKIDHDPDACIIPFGNLLRSLGIDELPQLINVLKGEMSLIGPRPCMHYEAAEFRIWQFRRFDTHPGLTGLWQVSGKNKTTFDDMMRLDIKYGQKRTLFQDIVIFFKTFYLLYDQAVNLRTRTKRRSLS
jgi:lipopolysaccharide/colanic/teichoic acid biosynthesis glycosyltransferase